jgi:AcrR family transcriptional regulator
VSELPRPRDDVRARLIDVAADLLRQHGVGALTTRAVAERGGVQAPTIYRLFGDKDGLLDALAERVMADFAARKAAASASGAEVDPFDDLRAGWDMTIEFGLAYPDLYVLLSDPERSRRSPATQAGLQQLAARVHRVALAGRLAIAEDRAVELIHAAGTGAILSTLARPADARDWSLADDMFAAVAARLLIGGVAGAVEATEAAAAAGPRAEAATSASAAIALRAQASDLSQLSEGERALLAEWLDRVIAAS